MSVDGLLIRALHYQILKQQVLTVAKAVEDKLDDEIAALDRLDIDDLEALRERRLQQMKKMAEKRNRWISLGHGDYSEIPTEKEFFSVVKASERVVCHFYRDNWPCKVTNLHLRSQFSQGWQLCDIVSLGDLSGVSSVSGVACGSS